MKPDQNAAVTQQGELARFKLPRTRGVRCLCGWRFIAKYAFATILGRAFAFVGEQHRDRRVAVDLLHPARLFIQAADRRKLFGVSKPGLSHCRPQHIDSVVVDL